jgi:hypothetical protein
MAFAFVICCIVVFLYAARVASAYFYHGDACLVIAMFVANKIDEGQAVSEAELRNEIAGLIRASVIHGKIAADGGATDLNGHAFQIQHVVGDRVAVRTRFSLLQPIRSHAEVDLKAHKERLQTTPARNAK